MHLRVIVTWLTEHIDNVPCRIGFMLFPFVHDRSDLHSRICRHFPAGSIFGSLEEPADNECAITRRFQPSFFISGLQSRLRPVPAISHRIRFCDRNTYVVRHETALHEHPCLIVHHMKDSYERFDGAFDDLHYLSLASMTI